MTWRTPDRAAVETAGTDVWERWTPMFNVGFTAVLAVSTLAALLDPALAAPQRLAVAGLGLLFGMWHWRLITILPSAGRDVKRALLYFAGACAFFATLTSFHPVFMFLVFFLYLQLFAFLPIAIGIVLSGPLTLVVWWRGAAANGNALAPNSDTLIALILVWLASAVLSIFIDRIIVQSDQRRQLIEELAATREGLAVAERQAGIVEERQRLAREIHDTLAQGFASIVLHLEAAEAVLPPGNAPLQRHLDQARRTARESLAEARRLVWALRPASLEHSSLAQALTRLAARWSEETGVPACVVLAEAATGLHPELEVTLLRAAQEGLANARKHAHATAVALTLTIMSDLVTLDIQDDGVGFEPAVVGPLEAGSGGFGLTSLRERIERLDGTLTVESSPGGGTTIAIALPTAISVSPEQSLAVGAAR